jgi:hypothetical protein
MILRSISFSSEGLSHAKWVRCHNGIARFSVVVVVVGGGIIIIIIIIIISRNARRCSGRLSNTPGQHPASHQKKTAPAYCRC